MFHGVEIHSGTDQSQQKEPKENQSIRSFCSLTVIDCFQKTQWLSERLIIVS